MTSKKPPPQGVREIVYFLTSANSYTVVHTFVLDILQKAGQNNPMGIIGSVVWQVKAFIAYIYCQRYLVTCAIFKRHYEWYEKLMKHMCNHYYLKLQWNLSITTI